MSASDTDPLEMLARRRSVKAQELQEPGPDDETLRRLLAAAIRVPDHGKLAPWRFLVLEGEGRGAAGKVLAERFAALHPEADAEAVEAERARFERAPVVVAVVSRVNRRAVKIPEWEQRLSAGAACQNLLNAAMFAGFAAQWLTEWYAYDEGVAEGLGLGENERFAGFVYIGSAAEPPEERKRPDIDDVVERWKG